jgi:hypothetical protein
MIQNTLLTRIPLTQRASMRRRLRRIVPSILYISQIITLVVAIARFGAGTGPGGGEAGDVEAFEERAEGRDGGGGYSDAGSGHGPD